MHSETQTLRFHVELTPQYANITCIPAVADQQIYAIRRRYLTISARTSQP